MIEECTPRRGLGGRDQRRRAEFAARRGDCANRASTANPHDGAEVELVLQPIGEILLQTSCR
jgi:hypothetical protein